MNLDEKLKNMEPKDTPLLVIGYILLGMMLLLPATANADDNQVLIDQTGDTLILDVFQLGSANSVDVKLGVTSVKADNLEMRVLQSGEDNNIFFSIDGSSNKLTFIQQGKNQDIGWTDTWGSGYSWGGDIDGDNNDIDVRQECSQTTCNKNEFGTHISGNSNTVKWGQGLHISSSGVYTQDSSEYGGTYARIDIHGSSNTLYGSQTTNINTGTTGHVARVNLYSNSNDVYVRQKSYAKTLNLTTYSNANDVSILQQGDGLHSATVTLSGSYATALDLTQQGATAQSYSLSQSCATVGGCSVSITQE